MERRSVPLWICSGDVKSLLEQKAQDGMSQAGSNPPGMARDWHKALLGICLFKTIPSFSKEAESQYCLL